MTSTRSGSEDTMLLGLPLHRTASALDSHLRPVYPPISLADLSIFLSDLSVALFSQVPVSTIFSCLLITFIFVLFVLPFSVFRSRWIKSPYPFIPKPSLLQDITYHLVRLAFVHFPHSIGRTFFSESACLGMFVERIGGSEVFRRHCHRVDIPDRGVTGWWVAPGRADALSDPGEVAQCDVVLVYIHGGGLTMGSPAFYLEFLLSIAAELRLLGFESPAVFAPEYPLVPEKRYPTQLEAIERAWSYVVECAGEKTKVGIGGDSAGAGIAIASMFGIAQDRTPQIRKSDFAVLISPWASMLHPPPLDSPLCRSDFVSPPALQHFAHLYSSAQSRARHSSLLDYLICLLPYLRGSPQREFDSEDVKALHRALCLKHPLLSPADISQSDWCARAIPDHVYISYGAGEVLEQQCRELADRIGEIDGGSGKKEVIGRVWPMVHAPPMVGCYIGRDAEERRRGVKDIAEFVFVACKHVD